MKKGVLPFDKYFFFITLLIVLLGILSFVSASLGILARNESIFYGVLFNQLVLGFGGGLIALFLCMRIPYLFWRKFSFYFFIISLVLAILVFVPGLGFEHGGAKRWLSLGPVSFQPAELLKITFVMYFGAWLVWARKKKAEFAYKIVPLISLLAISAVVLLKQPDTKSLILICIAAVAMLFISGVSWKKLAIIGGVVVLAASLLAIFRPNFGLT